MYSACLAKVLAVVTSRSIIGARKAVEGLGKREYLSIEEKPKEKRR